MQQVLLYICPNYVCVPPNSNKTDSWIRDEIFTEYAIRALSVNILFVTLNKVTTFTKLSRNSLKIYSSLRHQNLWGGFQRDFHGFLPGGLIIINLSIFRKVASYWQVDLYIFMTFNLSSGSGRVSIFIIKIFYPRRIIFT